MSAITAPAPNGGGVGGDYFLNDWPAPSFIIDLGADCLLEDFDYYGLGNKNSASNITLNFATSSQGVLGFSSSETFSLASGSNQQNNTLTTPVTARYVQVVLNDNFYDDGNSGGDRVGLKDIQFNGTKGATAVVPIKKADNAQYDFLINPVGVKELNGDGVTTLTDGNRLQNLIDGTLTTPTTASWYTRDIGSNDGTMSGGTPVKVDYFTNGVSPILQFDLGGEHLLNGLTIWGYNPVGNLLKEFGLNFYDADNNLLDSGFTFLLEDAISPSQSVDFSFSQLHGVQYVEMIMLDNFYGQGSGGDRVGFAGIRFHGMNTPEPATWVMMALGLSAGAVVYRRRRG